MLIRELKKAKVISNGNMNYGFVMNVQTIRVEKN
jgi:hypothetical protein